MIHPRVRLILAAPAEQLTSECQVDVFQIHEEDLVQKACIGEHSAPIRRGAAHRTKNGARCTPGRTIWLARALPPDGKLLTLEYEPKHAEVARANIARAGLVDTVEVRLGAGLDLLLPLRS